MTNKKLMFLCIEADVLVENDKLKNSDI